MYTIANAYVAVLILPVPTTTIIMGWSSGVQLSPADLSSLLSGAEGNEQENAWSSSSSQGY